MRVPRWFSPVLIAAIVFVFAGWSQNWAPIERLENLSRDWRFAIRGPQTIKTPITIIAIDDKSLAAPELSEPLIFWGDHYTKVFQSLHDFGAKAVGFDMVQPVPLAGYLDPNPDEAESAILMQMPEAVLSVTRSVAPNAQFRTAIALGGGRFGQVNTAPDSDGVVRKFLPKVENDLAFATQLAALFTGKEPTLSDDSIDLAGRSIARDENGRCLIDFVGPDGTFPRISFVDFVQNPAKYRNQIEGHICLIGTTSADLQDIHLAPFAGKNAARLGRPNGEMAGVELHANMISTLLTGGIFRAGTALSWLLIGLALLVSVPWCWLKRPVWVAPAILVLLLVWLAICFLAFSRFNWQLPMVPVLIAIALNGISVIALRLRRESGRKQHIENIFGRYVSSNVLNHLLDVPGAAELGGKRQIVTVLFSDIRGFTTQSEHMEPEAVTSFLNNYLGKMVEIIYAHGGTVDKFLGDGIMAIWNWPLDQEDHARRATLAAIAMQRHVRDAATSWESAGFGALRIGIGIHTGLALVGNIGSPNRMEATTIGDTINTASRLEGLNKEWGASFGGILLSSATRDSILASPSDFGAAFEMRLAGETALRGRQESLEVFAIMEAEKLQPGAKAPG